MSSFKLLKQRLGSDIDSLKKDFIQQHAFLPHHEAANSKKATATVAIQTNIIPDVEKASKSTITSPKRDNNEENTQTTNTNQNNKPLGPLIEQCCQIIYTRTSQLVPKLKPIVEENPNCLLDLRILEAVYSFYPDHFTKIADQLLSILSYNTQNNNNMISFPVQLNEIFCAAISKPHTAIARAVIANVQSRFVRQATDSDGNPAFILAVKATASPNSSNHNNNNNNNNNNTKDTDSAADNDEESRQRLKFALLDALIDDYQVDVNQRAPDGQTAVHIAASKNDASLLDFLISRQADVSNVKDGLGRNALEIAQEGKSVHAECTLHHAMMIEASLKGNEAYKRSDFELALDSFKKGIEACDRMRNLAKSEVKNHFLTSTLQSICRMFLLSPHVDKNNFLSVKSPEFSLFTAIAAAPASETSSSNIDSELDKARLAIAGEIFEDPKVTESVLLRSIQFACDFVEKNKHQHEIANLLLLKKVNINNTNGAVSRRGKDDLDSLLYAAGTLHEVRDNLTKLHYNSARALFRLGRMTDCISACDSCLELDENYLNGFNQRAQAYSALGKYEEALRDYETLSKLQPGESEWRRLIEETKKHNSIDYYSLLKLPQFHESADDIKKSYRKLALQYHPDKTSHMSVDEKSRATTLFAKICTAYGVLSDSQKKTLYDAELATKLIAEQQQKQHHQQHSSSSLGANFRFNWKDDEANAEHAIHTARMNQQRREREQYERELQRERERERELQRERELEYQRRMKRLHEERLEEQKRKLEQERIFFEQQKQREREQKAEKLAQAAESEFKRQVNANLQAQLRSQKFAESLLSKNSQVLFSSAAFNATKASTSNNHNQGVDDVDVGGGGSTANSVRHSMAEIYKPYFTGDGEEDGFSSGSGVEDEVLFAERFEEGEVYGEDLMGSPLRGSSESYWGSSSQGGVGYVKASNFYYTTREVDGGLGSPGSRLRRDVVGDSEENSSSGSSVGVFYSGVRTSGGVRMDSPSSGDGVYIPFTVGNF